MPVDCAVYSFALQQSHVDDDVVPLVVVGAQTVLSENTLACNLSASVFESFLELSLVCHNDDMIKSE